MHIPVAAATDLFVGSEDRPLQVVRATVANDGGARTPAAAVSVRGERLSTPEPVELRPLDPGGQTTVEVGVAVGGTFPEGTLLPAEVIVHAEDGVALAPLDFVVAEPGWRMFMVSHFHYDPVWWNTQAAYTEEWADIGADVPWERSFQAPAFKLIAAHLDMARRDPDYHFVLAELDYLKPYWDVFPQDRDEVRELLRSGRLELMGGTYNEANTNLVSAENTVRNAVYGIGYQRDVLGGSPATAWQLDVFGHDPQFPGLMADAGLDCSSWARGPFHEWGPNWARGGSSQLRDKHSVGGNTLMQFPTEFDWVSPSGRSLVTCYMANHYSAGWWMDSAPTLAEAEAETYRLFRELKAVAATKNVLLPVGTDYSPPNKWVTEIQRDWNARYVWPRFVSANPRDFFAAVRGELASSGRGLTPQTRDMNPVYTGKDVSYIDTKQMHRDAENTLLDAEKFATFAALLGGRYPAEAFDKAWRQLVFNAHHDGITGSESDQVYLDLLGGWREAFELARESRDGALSMLGAHIDTTGEGRAVTVFNALSWTRTDIARAEVAFSEPGTAGVELRDDAGQVVPSCVEWAEHHDDGSLARAGLAFVARDVPGIGYRSYRAVGTDRFHEDAGWAPVDGQRIENARYLVEVDASRGGAVSRVLDKQAGKELLKPGGLANELLAYDEYPQHPHFAEGPWHLVPTGTKATSTDEPVDVLVERCPIGARITVAGPFHGCNRTQEIVLWDGVDRVDLRTHLDDFSGQDTLFRVRVAADVEGGMPVSEVANAVVGRGFGFPNVDVAEVPFTLDHPCAHWFEVGATAKVVLQGGGASRAISVAEVIAAAGTADQPAVRDLVTALVRAGVTSTVSQDTGSRYGRIDLDSNLPDFRIAWGGPEDNAFTAAVLAEADPEYGTQVDRQLTAHGTARVWVPAAKSLEEVWMPNANLCGARDLPVLIVAGPHALESLTADLADAVIEVDQPQELDDHTGRVEDYGIALLNRGTPGFSVDPSGDLYLSLMRSSSGWPSGIWIDPPRRTLPDGGNFQFQHWSHTFEYALYGHGGDWRAGAVVRAGHGYNHPLVARTFDAHPGTLRATAALLEADGADVVVTTVKPAGNPMARGAGADMDPRAGIVVRAYEAAGRPTRAELGCHWPLRDGFTTDLLEEHRTPLATHSGLHLDLGPCAVATVGAVPDAPADDAAPVALGPRAERAQPVFADYWLHNRGVAPMGNQPVTVQIAPTIVTAAGPFTLPVAVASGRTDGAVAGRVELALPPGWGADPPERIYRLGPGEHFTFDVGVTPGDDARPGRYFVAARIRDDAGQLHEDVVTVDYGRGGAEGGAVGISQNALRIDRATRRAAVVEIVPEPTGAGLGNELTMELRGDGLTVAAGRTGMLTVSLRNATAAEIRGEAQLLSPYETWPVTTPWTQGFAVRPGAEEQLVFTVDVPIGFRPGTFWALVKAMYFGRRIYSEAVPVVVRAASDPR